VVGSVGLRALSFDALGDAGNDRRSLGPSISWGLFDYGRLRQQIKTADARSEAALANYQQTVLLALEDTDNALSDYGRERQRLAALQRTAAASAQAADLATKRFEGGVADFLTVLDAARTELEAEDLLASSHTRAATSLIAVYKALGGGWNNGAP
jgi:multidrug efflux system outer membrane protein